MKSHKKHDDWSKEKRSEYNHIHYLNNKEKYSQRTKKYYSENKERLNELRKEYYKDNKNFEIEQTMAYKKNKRNTNPSYKIEHSLRTRINSIVRKLNISKYVRTMKFVDCTIQELKSYLEQKFYKNMTWKDYGQGKGKWQVDHIKPCCSFNLLDLEQQKICFHYTNLQPLWYEDHLEKTKKDKFLKNE